MEEGEEREGGRERWRREEGRRERWRREEDTDEVKDGRSG